METFSALPDLYAGNSPVTGEFPSQRPVTRSFDIFFDLQLNNRLNKQSRWRWYETPSGSLWRHCYDVDLQAVLIATDCVSASITLPFADIAGQRYTNAVKYLVTANMLLNKNGRFLRN